MRRKLICLALFIMYLSVNSNVCFAQNDVTITVMSNVESDRVTVSGIISTGEGEQISLLVTAPDETIAYIDQQKSGVDGTYSFEFKLPSSSAEGVYNVMVGGKNASMPAESSFKYSSSINNNTETANISATASVIGNNVTVSGEIDSGSGKQITILVTSPDKTIVYIDQKVSGENGAYKFEFKLPSSSVSGIYDIKIGGTEVSHPTQFSLEYKSEEVVLSKVEFVNADININIDNYTPTIEGKISCKDGISTDINIINITNQQAIANDTVTSENGIFNLSYQLPNLILPKKYAVSIVCRNEMKNMCVINLTVDSSVALVTISGSVELSQNVTVNAGIHSNSGIIDKSTIITENRSVSMTIPNILANISYNIKFQGYDEITDDPTEEDGYKCVVTGKAGDEINIIAVASGISSFDEKEFELKFNDNQIEAVSFFPDLYDDYLQIGSINDVEIISYSPGEIIFKVSGREMPDGEAWSGALNSFRFRFKNNYSGNTEIQIIEHGN